MNSKMVKIVFGICAASAVLAGCGDPDSHPSQMTKIRGSMQQQKDQMRSGLTTAPGTPGSANAGATGGGVSNGQ